jgi:predicted ribosome quality control (RQC) complex YloA/Tae2 family protein
MKLSALHIARWVSEALEVITGNTISSLHKDEVRKLVTIELAGPSAIRLSYLFLPGESLIYFESETHEQTRKSQKTTNFLPQLIGAEVTGVEQIRFDRIVKVSLSGQTEFSLLFELFGPSSNVFLLNSGDMIVTSLKDSPDKDVYNLPEQPEGILPYGVRPDNLRSAIREQPEKQLRKAIKKAVRGCDESFWDLALSGIDDSEAIEDIDDGALGAIVNSILDTYDKSTTGRHPVALSEKSVIWKTPGDERQVYASLNDAIADAAQELSYNAAMKSIRQRISQGIRNNKKRLEGKLSKLTRLLADSGDATRYREWAELLTVNIQSIRRGMTSITVTNLFDKDQQEISIPLQNSAKPSVNIDRLFKKYRKLTDGVAASKKQVSEIDEELDKLRQYRDQLDDATDLTALFKLERILLKRDILKPRKKRKSSHRSEPEERFNPRAFSTSAGEIMLVGRNNRENEYVTFVVAKKYDIWFHSQQTPGSHVILQLADKTKPPSQESIIEAAQTAAYFSQARTSSKVPVIFTEVRHLQKIKGAMPGKVKYTRIKSIMVEPKSPRHT